MKIVKEISKAICWIFVGALALAMVIVVAEKDEPGWTNDIVNKDVDSEEEA